MDTIDKLENYKLLADGIESGKIAIDRNKFEKTVRDMTRLQQIKHLGYILGYSTLL